MKNYYSILGVRRSASSLEIKRAFRRLALLYHPDRNKHPAAHRIFQEINEAYTVLGDPQKRFRYDHQLHTLSRSRTSAQAQQRHAHEVFRRKAAQQARKKRESHIAYFKKYAPYAGGICLIVAIWVNLLVLDYFLPAKASRQTIVERTRSATSNTTVIITTENFQFPFDKILMPTYFNVGETIIVESTPIFRTVTRLRFEAHGRTLEAKPHYSIYSVWSFFLVLLFITANSGAFAVRKDYELRFNLAYVSVFLSVLMVMFLLATH